MGHIKYPKIGSIKDVMFEVRRRAEKYEMPPTLHFEGTVKLHGCNCSVVIDGTEVRFQSRNRILSVENDHIGFAQWGMNYDWHGIFEYPGHGELPLVAYGEWIGEGVQTGVAISELERRFVLFGLKYGDNWLPSQILKDTNFPDGIETVYDVETWELDIDFRNPHFHQDAIIAATQEVEDCCPFGKLHGVEGIGEGIVWKCTDEHWRDLMFKVKGEKHSKSKVKVLKPVDIEKLNKANNLASEIMTPERMNGGIDYIKEMGLELVKPSLGAYLKYVVSDTIKEEQIKIEESGLTSKEMGKALSEIAKNYFLTLEREL